MTSRSSRYMARKWLEKKSVKISFKHESSFINDLFMFGRCIGRAKVNDQGLPTFGHITPEEFLKEFSKQ